MLVFLGQTPAERARHDSTAMAEGPSGSDRTAGFDTAAEHLAANFQGD